MFLTKILRKTMIWILLIAALSASAFFVFQYEKSLLPSGCDNPLRFAIGRIDPQFGISKGKFLRTVMEARTVWSEAASKRLLLYDPQADFKINLIYDERQRQSDEARELAEEKTKTEATQQEIYQNYQSLTAAYNQKLKIFNAEVDDYKKRLDKYNDTVDYWNKRGGAPKDDYEELEKEGRDLQALSNKIEKDRQEVNDLANRANALSQQEKKMVDIFNAQAETYQSKYGKAQEFEQGVFDGKEINIYQYNETSDLRLVLTHEFGHMLGIGHLKNPDSVMYYMMEKQNLDPVKLTDEDMQAINDICKIK